MSTKELQSIDLGKLAQVTGGNIVAPGASQMNTMLQEITSALASLGGGSSTGTLGLGGTTAAAPSNGSSSMDQMMSMMMMMMGRGGSSGGGGFPFGGNSGGFPF